MTSTGFDDAISLAASIVSAYISHNAIPHADVPDLVATVHGVLTKLGAVEPALAPVERRKPAAPIKKSVFEDYIICLEDGLRYKSLKRHLRTRYNLTPEQYRAKWQLPPDYPMVAPGYALRRSQMARDMGLGQRRKGKRKTPR